MKAISLWQPWATLLVTGAKKIETRHWPTNYRGPLLIHAAKRFVKSELRLINEDERLSSALGSQNVFNLPFGALVGVVELVDCVRVENLDRGKLHADRGCGDSAWCEFDLGNYEPGRFAWICEDAHAFAVPLDYKGSQGFFDVADHELQMVARRR